MFKFDLKNGFHHIDIFELHQKFLGFSWEFKGNIKFFVFTVLPFGLTSAPFFSPKVVRPLVKYWRFNSVKITCFLDDGIGIEYNYEEEKDKSEFVQETLTKSGFIPNIQKSSWEPWKIITWLWIDINLPPGTLKSPSLSLIKFWIQFLLLCGRYLFHPELCLNLLDNLFQRNM